MTLEQPRVAMLSVHTSPLDQPGAGDAGGMNVYVAELSRALALRGARVEIFTRATSSALPETVVLDGTAADGSPLTGEAAREVLLAAAVPPGVVPPVLVHHVPAGPFEGLDKNDLPGQLCAMAAGVLRSEAARRPGWYDVVHSHYWLSGQVGWLAADRWEIPLVHTMHTMAKVKNASLAPGDSPEPLGRIIGEEQVVAAADALVASTAQEADELVQLYNADPARVHVVAPGVDLELFTPGPGRQAERAALGLPVDRDIVLFAGRVQPLKGPDVLVRAVAEIAAAGRPVPLLVVLGGPSGRPTAVRELQALAASSGVEADVLFRPPVPREELARWYRAADLVAMPSRSESFGLVAVEAQACGTPVLASAVGGLRSVVVEGVSGRLVPSHDPRAWADAMSAALASPELRSAWPQGARRVAERYGWDATAAQMLKAYAMAADHRRR
ncbi:D-inositol-3-phosphate glycosyltransferase [Cellulomonas chengniuliangii]|uniref:D-inositol-3-phosphate glycosyltransferase n=1 Tax=Cellulomonas chengniuliangii TaxID=2968084 RepID=A0ABY5KZA8_9CELL|nr:D-inositol-3-phosphate glycosyltransferase [Cellulomonas chengniuliangii]MCC2307357.1 D-inositol-3-phosphate glycosyltransferase [Cellulomonas chengniuliangii]MCC2317747.1 D-inositol-3-phosphate glycosyltransferase [Cellulomonas chengniuliangii]UUI75856.1 D-inositol-3-phosphate glycosyltransferase [Cellulomonas chengniuliangii]